MAPCRIGFLMSAIPTRATLHHASGEAGAVLTPGARAIGIVYLAYFIVAAAPLILTRGIRRSAGWRSCS